MTLRQLRKEEKTRPEEVDNYYYWVKYCLGLALSKNDNKAIKQFARLLVQLNYINPAKYI